jgi:NAD(P)-dependent dehydrogenase (short-subunit alcohol dehydrogenase family)
MGKFIFDGPTKKIHLNPTYVVSGVLSFSCLELWSRWVDWQAENSQYLFALDIIYVPSPAGGFIGPYLFLRNDLGWVGVPPPVDGVSIQVTGGAFYGMSAALPVMENVVGQETDMVVQQSNIVNTISISGTAGPTAAEIAAAVLAALSAATIPVDTKKINGAQLSGNGTTGNPWGPL